MTLTRNSSLDMGNPQESGNVASLDWLAGITDGEGCIALMVFKGGKRHQVYGGFRLQMRVTIANTNHGVVDRIIAILKSLDIGHHIQTQVCKSKRRETGKVITLVHVATKPNILKLLKILRPRLADTDKKERAGILIQLIEQREAFAKAAGLARSTHSYTKADADLILRFLSLTRSKQVDHLTALLNDCTREARQEKAGYDTVWSRSKGREVAEMPTRQAA